MKTLKKKARKMASPEQSQNMQIKKKFFVTDSHLKAAAQHYHAKIIIQF